MMTKFIFVILFMNLMVLFNKKVMFYYNICYALSLIFLFKFLFKDDMLWVNLSLMFGYDLYSFFLLVLSLWILGLMFMTIQLDKMISNSDGKKLMVFMIMLIILVLFFSSMNLMLFYLMFELSLIPTFMMIIYWGMNFERLTAAYYLLMYTMFISLPLLIYMMKLFKLNGSFDFNLLKLIMMENFKFGWWDYMILFMAFYIKMPIYMFHVWLPKAHVEAPVYGSMILAAILLKLGSYGLLRFMEMFMYNSYMYNYVIFSVGIIGSIVISLVCLIQIDMKSLVAYSSVVHMNVLMCSMMTLMKLGFISAYIMMISHGLCSSGLFFMVNLYYERSNSRLLFFNKGMMNLLPSMSMWWFILCASNFSFPFSLNFISEILMIMVIISWEVFMMIYLMIICFFSSAYSLYLYSYVQHGFVYSEERLSLINLKDYLILFIHIYPLIMLILNLSFLY
uniref:NADH-ubiquinone oxidoreductase chain 4 n=1 Tax=Lasius spathepus TaxID=67765 RepID=A0A7S6XWU0_9HYME|nr:NADH dehydrogenase subunit 4 [Lasius spathepus]QOW83452.1 NADH dehydrogenase subunit 4 [Lasius spathepus]